MPGPWRAFSAVKGSSFQNVSHWSTLFFLFIRSYDGQVIIFFLPFKLLSRQPLEASNLLIYLLGYASI